MKQTQTTPLRIVGHEPKEWEVYEEGFGKCRLMPFFPLHKGIYEMRKDGNETYLVKKFDNPEIGKRGLLMYKELIDELNNGGTILVDEDILSL